MSKRFRMFAGPNGSGKSTLIKAIRDEFNIGYFVNADRVFVIDNSNVNRTVVLEKSGKEVLLHTSKIPEWVNEFLLKKIEIQ